MIAIFHSSVEEREVFIRDLAPILTSRFTNRYGNKVYTKNIMNDKALDHIGLPALPSSDGSALYRYGKSWGFPRAPYEWGEDGLAKKYIEAGYENWKMFYMRLTEKEQAKIDKLFARFPMNDYAEWPEKLST